MSKRSKGRPKAWRREGRERRIAVMRWTPEVIVGVARQLAKDRPVTAHELEDVAEDLAGWLTTEARIRVVPEVLWAGLADAAKQRGLDPEDETWAPDADDYALALVNLGYHRLLVHAMETMSHAAAVDVLTTMLPVIARIRKGATPPIDEWKPNEAELAELQASIDAPEYFMEWVKQEFGSETAEPNS